jgi:hypothetical protein
MYTLIRKVHQFTGLMLLAFVVMYFVTGYVIVHHEWFGGEPPVKTTRTETLRGSLPSDADEAAAALQEMFALNGMRYAPVRRGDGTWRFSYRRPGVDNEAVVSADGRSVKITETRRDGVGTLVGLHRLHGYRGGWAYCAWAVMYDLASMAMIVFAITGVYLWYKLTTKRTLGWVMLGVGCLYTIVMVVYLVHAA